MGIERGGMLVLAPVQTGLRELASPFLHDIYAATRATVHLAVREGTQMLYLDRLAGHESVPVVSRIGSRLPLHCTGVGKVLLANALDDVVTEVMSSLSRSTPFTVTHPGTLRAQLDRVRRDGYATTTDEMSLGASSVAVPMVCSAVTGDEVAAVLGIVVPQLHRPVPTDPGSVEQFIALDEGARRGGRLPHHQFDRRDVELAGLGDPGLLGGPADAVEGVEEPGAAHGDRAWRLRRRRAPARPSADRGCMG